MRWKIKNKETWCRREAGFYMQIEIRNHVKDAPYWAWVILIDGSKDYKYCRSLADAKRWCHRRCIQHIKEKIRYHANKVKICRNQIKDIDENHMAFAVGDIVKFIKPLSDEHGFFTITKRHGGSNKYDVLSDNRIYVKINVPEKELTLGH